MKRRIAITSLLNLFNISMSFVLGLILLPLMIRYLGKEGYGVWVLLTAFSVVSGFMSLLDLGVQSAIVKFVSEYYVRNEINKINQIFSAGLYLFIGLGFIGAIFLSLFSYFFLTEVFNIPPGLKELTRLMFLLLAVQILFDFPGLILSAVIDGLQRYDLNRAVMFVYVIVFSSALILLLLSGYGLFSLSMTMLIMSILKVILLVIVLLHLFPELKLLINFESGILNRVFNFSWRMFLIRINAIIYNTMDKTIIGTILNTSRLTEYDVANKLRSISITPLSLFAYQVTPSASMLYGMDDKTRLQDFLIKGTKYQMAISVPVITSVLILSERFIEIWIGHEYVYIVSFARLFVVSVFIDAMIAVGQNMLIGVGRIKPLIWISMMSTIGNLAVSIFLTIKLGVMGVMWGTLFGLLICLGPYLWLFKDTFKVALSVLWKKSFQPAFLVSAVFAVLLFSADIVYSPQNLLSFIVMVGCSMVVYALLFFFFCLNSNEKTMIFNFIKFSK